MKRIRYCAAFLGLLAASASARAQQKGDVGLIFGYPTGVGLQWQATTNTAARLDVALGASSINAGSDSWSGTLGVAALFRVAGSDSHTVYLAPRIGYSWVTAQSGTSTTTVALSGAVGVRRILTSRFGLFGEAGLMGSYQESSVSVEAIKLPGSALRRVSTMGGVGVLLIF